MNTSAKRLDKLKSLEYDEFEEILSRLEIEVAYLPGSFAPQTSRAIAALKLIEQKQQSDRLDEILADPEALRQIQPYGLEIETKVKEVLKEYTSRPFAGRSREQDQINQFIEQNSSGVFLVTAPAGFGKSALLSHWQETQQEKYFVAFHCFRSSSDVMKSVSNAYRHLLRQLSFYYRPRKKEFPVDESGMREALLKMITAEVRQDKRRPLIIVLDGLDEAEKTFEPFFTSLPEGVYVIASARAEQDDEPKYLKGWVETATRRLPLNRLPREALADWVGRINGLTAYAEKPDFIEALDIITDGFPLYLRYLLDDLKQAAEQGKDVQMLLTNSPRGFTKYVEQQFEQLAEAADSEKVQALFVLLSVALGALSKSDIKALTGLGAWDLPKLPWQVTRWFSIRSDSYSFAHPLLADQFQQVLGTEETDSAKSKLINYCANWQENQSSYALRYYADHLQEAKQLELLYELARNEAFANAQRRGIPDAPELSLKNIKLALQSKAEADKAGGMVEFLLLHVRRKIEMAQESPLDALRAGSLERAWKLADQASREDCILWHLLLAWSLVTGNKFELDSLELAKKTLKRLKFMQLTRLSDWKAEYAVYLLSQFLVAPEVLQHQDDELDLSFIQKVLTNKERQELYREYIKKLKEIAQLNSGGATAAQMTLTITLSLAQQTEGSFNKATALVTIATVQANAGDSSAALSLAQQIEDSFNKAIALVAIAIAQLNASDATAAQMTLNTALTTAQQIEDSCAKVEALKEIAIAQLDASDATAAQMTLNTALTTAQQIIEDQYSFYKAGALKNIAIAQAKAGDTAAALTTAQQIEELFSYSEEKIEALKNIAIVQLNAGDATAAQMTLNTARTAAQYIRGSSEKAEALKNIAIVQLDAGDASAALTTVQQIEYSFDRATALVAIATVQANAGDASAALSIVQQIEDSFNKAIALVAIAIAQLDADNATAAQMTLNTALTTAQQIEGSSEKAEALIDIAIAQAKVGDAAAAQMTLNTALTAAQQIEGSYKAWVLKSIGIAQLNAGNATAALTTAQQIEDSSTKAKALKEIAIAQLNAGDVTAAQMTLNTALTTAQQIEGSSEKAEALIDIAIAQLSTGNATAVLTTAQQIEDTFDRARALKEIAIAQLNASDATAAQTTLNTVLTTAQQIPEDPKVWALKEIAIAQLNAGDATAAQMTLNTALTTAQQIKDSSTKAEALKEIAIAQLNASDAAAAQMTLNTALTIAQQIEDSFSKAEALIDIAIAQLNAGDATAAQMTLNTALTTAQQMKYSSSKAEALIDIAIAQANLGNAAGALTTAQQIDYSSFNVVEALKGITIAQLNVGNAVAALTTAQQIEIQDLPFTAKAEALTEIAIAQLNAGDAAAAQMTLNTALTATQQIEVQYSSSKVAALTEIAIAQAKVGDAAAAQTTLNTALTTVQQITEDAQAWLLRGIAIAQLNIGDTTAAQMTLNTALTAAHQSKDSSYKARVLEGIAIAQLKVGDTTAAQMTLNTALATAEQIEDPSAKAEALKDIAIAQLKVGDTTAAQMTLNSALTAAQQIIDDQYSFYKARALKEIAIAQAKADNTTAAFTTAQQIEDPSTKAEALKDIAIAQVKAKLDEQATAIAEEILTKRNKHLPEIAAAFVEMGDTEHFKQLLIPCAEYLDAAYIMCGYLAKLYPQQATALAKVVSEFSVGKAQC